MNLVHPVILSIRGAYEPDKLAKVRIFCIVLIERRFGRTVTNMSADGTSMKVFIL